MLDLTFVIVYVCTPFLILMMLRLLNEQVSKISLISFTTVNLYAFSVVGTLPLFFMLDEYRVSTGISNPIIVFYVLMASVSSLILFLTGVAIYKVIIPEKKYYHVNEVRLLNIREYSILLVGLLLSILFFYSYAKQIDQYAIFIAISDGVKEAKVARSDMGNNFSGKYHWYSLFIHDFLNMITYVFYMHWLLRKNFRSFAVFILAFLLAVFAAVMATEKAPLLDLFIAMALSYIITKNNGKFSLKVLILFLSITLTIGALLYKLFMGSDSFGNAFASIFSRAFAGSIGPAYHYLEYFPKEHDFLYGQSFPNPGGLMPYTPFKISVEVMRWVHPELDQTGLVGSMPTVFWGEAYANFGIVGIFIIPILIGLLLGFFSSALNFKDKSPISLGYYVWVIMHLKKLAITGFSGYLIDFYLISMTILFLLIMFLSKIRLR